MLMWHAGEGARWAAAAERRMHCAVTVRDLKKQGFLVRTSGGLWGVSRPLNVEVAVTCRLWV